MTTTENSKPQMGGRPAQPPSPPFSSSYVQRAPVIDGEGIANARRDAQPGAIEPIDSASQFIDYPSRGEQVWMFSMKPTAKTNPEPSTGLPF